ncbi:transglutaminase domain-containing protein [Mycoplasma sp. 3686d]|uniref:transglutaminase domain-containing protein n=1 Tax=Mycoplasma sp. 3686d TaxID=2967300 RepID=UPI00211C6B9A|nr:transglutaminase-like domain-containing protein [Mycoplasma sp. 3686d]UUM25107.1 transglutaminase-like domain-containing protein [Mycoplasma sp. 3686d]
MINPQNKTKINSSSHQIKEVVKNINQLNLKYKFAVKKSQGRGIVKLGDQYYKYWKNSSIANFDFDKFNQYQKYADVKTYNYVFEYANIYNDLLFVKPNLFSEALYRTLDSDLITPKHTRFEQNDPKLGKIYYDKTTSITKEESLKQGKDPWINPIPEYKRWFNRWKEILPKIINKNWDTQTKIKAISYYIVSNSLYLSAPKGVHYNYNGYGFYNPTQFFSNDPEIQCVGYSMNLAAALTILNIPVRIVGGAYFGSSSSIISSGYHAWNEVFIDNRWKIVDLTWFDYSEHRDQKGKTYELEDDVDLFLERNSEHKWRKQFRLDLNSYENTLLYFKNPPQYEYEDLPKSL